MYTAHTTLKMKQTWLLLVTSFAAAGCSGETDKITSPEEVATPIPYEGAFRTPLQLARRMSIDVRGEFMDADEIALVQEDTTNIDVLAIGNYLLMKE